MKPWSQDNLDAKFIVYHGYTACGDHGVEDIDNVVEYLPCCKIITNYIRYDGNSQNIAPFPVKIKEEDNRIGPNLKIAGYGWLSIIASYMMKLIICVILSLENSPVL